MLWLLLGPVRISTGTILENGMKPSYTPRRIPKTRFSLPNKEEIDVLGVCSRCCMGLIRMENADSVQFDSIFEAELQDVIPICRASIAGTNIIGRMTTGYVLSVHWNFEPRRETKVKSMSRHKTNMA